jgi:hypothetical protein
MALALKKRDFMLIGVAIVILAFLWQAPPESTSRVPLDDNHRQFHDLVKAEGKKAAEKFCEDCHKNVSLLASGQAQAKSAVGPLKQSDFLHVV